MDKKKIWEGQNRIASEGLDWLYAEPHQKDENAEEESYLLGKPLNKIDEKKNKFDSIEAPRQELINRFREDPLFVIKKLEHDQKKLIEKYKSIENKSRGIDKNRTNSKSDRHSKDRSERHRRSDRYDGDYDKHDRKRPKIPDKIDPLDYAFSSNPDIAPPDCFNVNDKTKDRDSDDNREKQPAKNSRMTYEEMREYGKERLEKTGRRSHHRDKRYR